MQYLQPSLPERVQRFAEAIHQQGGTAYIAGGFVRDMLLKHSCKDIDLEIHGLTPTALEQILSQFSPYKAVGKSFGIWKLLPRQASELEVDVTLPVQDDVPSPHMGVQNACRRRDLTINSILYNVHTQELVDPFNGYEDLRDRRLRATDDACFATDLLRVFRVGQFSGRLNATPTPELLKLCQQLTKSPEFSALPSERVLVELEKGWMKSPEPTQAMRIWISTEAFQTYFPELADFITQNDSPIWSRLSSATAFRQPNAGWSMALFWSVLLYDVSKEIICSLFDRIHLQKYLGFPIRKAVLLSQHHADTLNQSKSTIEQNLAREVFDIHFLCTVAHCIDPQGSALDNLEQSVERGIDATPLPRLINGGDVLQRGIQGAQIGALLTEIRFAQLQEIIHTRKDALAMLDSLLEQS